MKLKQKPIASAVALALLGAAYPALAQQAPRQPAQQLDTITVTGIRASVEKSIDTKKNSDSIVEVITAEDIGKMPDKNVADSLQRVVGVTISSQSGGSGGFDENDRVSMRGTNPSLTQTLINGHAVASGDWFVLDQVGLVGRSVSYSLLPSEIVSQVIVRKASTADLVEGGAAGSVDIITRKPLQFSKQVTLEGTFGGAGGTSSPSTCSSTHTPRLTGLVRLGNEVVAKIPGIPKIPPRLASVSETLRISGPVTVCSRP